MQKQIEITSPAGSYECLMAAIKAGAGSVYFGIEHLNMRARARNNFKLKDLKKIARICKENNVRSYLTVNTVMYDSDLELMKKICNEAKKAGIDAIIASDISVMQYCNSIEIKIHCSTQMNISNIEAVKFYAKYTDAIVLARELTLEQIKNICETIKKEKITGLNGNLIKIEIFIHGALCVSIAGKCYMSLAIYNAPANRGLCLQNCRRKYKVIDEETGDELILENNYVMSPKDLCTISFIDKILDAGVDILKIEGRARPPEYVYITTKAYKEAIESYYNGTYTKEKVESWIRELEKVYNRGFWHGGYYLGKKLGEWSGIHGSKATKEKEFVGICRNYFRKTKIGEFLLQSGEVNIGNNIVITGPTTGIVETKIDNIRKDNKDVKKASKGSIITMPIKEMIRKNDKLFILKDRTN